MKTNHNLITRVFPRFRHLTCTHIFFFGRFGNLEAVRRIHLMLHLNLNFMLVGIQGK